MKTELHIHKQQVDAFIEKCNLMQVTYVQIREDGSSFLYEVTLNYAHDLFYLGVGVGLELMHRQVTN